MLAETLIVAGVALADGMAKIQSVPVVLIVNGVEGPLVSNNVCASNKVPEKLNWLGLVTNVTSPRTFIVTATGMGLFAAVGAVMVIVPV